MTALRGLTGALVTAAAAVAMSPRRAVRCEAPVLDSPDHPQDQSQRCMAYLDEHVRWKTIYSDFSATGVQGNAASLQVMRAESDYTTESGNPVPLMRCIAYMPNVTADQVCSSMADVVKRLQWDKNYRHFAKLSELEEEVLPVNSSLLRPIEAVAQRKRHCQGDVCSFSPDASLSVVDNGFFCHAVGNTTFRRFGLADRLFAYQRVITKSFIRPEQCMYDFLFNGSPAVASSQCSRCPNIGAKLATYRGKSGVVDVDIHYQHHVIIPIADAPRQLCGNAERWDALATSGSLIHHSSTKILYDLLKESSTIPATSPGVLVIMTSASDIGLAARLPAWVENRLAIRTGREAYRMLKETLTQPTA